MVYKRTEYPSWSWSSSRKTVFNECLRKYYYNYYLSHNGWEDDAASESKQAYRLKKLTGLHLILGSAVHQAAEYACKTVDETGKFPEEKALMDMVRNVLNRAWNESKNKKREWIEKPNSYTMLHEFYYTGGPAKKTIEKIKSKMKTSIKNINLSDTIREILKDDCRIKIIETMDTFELFDTPIYAIPDLVFERPAGRWIVVDWKTGKEHDSHPGQINVYCMYLKEKHGVKEENISGRVEYLLTGRARDVFISRESFENTKKEIKESIARMRGVLLDPENNIPREKMDYPPTEHRRLCPWCNFYEMCKKEL